MTSGQMQQFNQKLWPKVEIYWRISKSHVYIKEFEELKRVQIKYFDAPVWVKYFCKPLCIFATGNDALFYKAGKEIHSHVTAKYLIGVTSCILGMCFELILRRWG